MSAPPQWHQQSSEKVLAQLSVTADGLSPAEAAARLASNGPNVLKEAQSVSAWRILIAQFNSLMIWILFAAGAVAGALGEWVDAIAIAAIVLLNAAIGFYQEWRAAQSIAALHDLSAPQAKVRRDGQVMAIAATEIVTGDVLVLEAGDLIAADARLLQAASLNCVESALTGESEAVDKQPEAMAVADTPLGDRDNLVFMGTHVAAGTGTSVVVATAMDTELGRIAGLIESAAADQATPLQKKLDAFSRVLVWAALGIVVLLFGLGALRGTPWLELTLTAISLAVAAVPEGLPAVVTVALSLGAQRMSRRHALVRKLAAVETLGSTSVICTDKTGTLTVGEMTARAFHVAGLSYEITGEGYGPAGEVRTNGAKAEGAHATPLLELAIVLLASNNAHLREEGGAWKTIGDPTEGALLCAGAKAGGDRVRIEQEMPVQQQLPFDSDRKRSTVIRKLMDGSSKAFTNGAPGSVLGCCTQWLTADGVRPLREEDRAQLLAQTSAMAKQALRVLASATRALPAATTDWTAETAEQALVFIGLTGLYDPPRPEAKEAISKCRAAGIRVVMITGDHPHTAAAIAQQLGIAADATATTGVQLDQLDDAALKTRVSDIVVYARVTAEHKLRIIRALKANDAVVAMTGDGVNDAPAIRGADIGIAMGRAGTEVTKQAADMVITDDRFDTIVAAVEEGRGIYDNIRKTLQYLLAGSTAELLLMTACVVIGLPAALLPIHLLWINLVTDGLPALCLATDRIDPDVMQRPPRHPLERITDAHFLRTMLFTGLVTASLSLAVYVYMLRQTDAETARSYAFTVLVFAEMLRAFGARSETMPVWRIPLFGNRNLVMVVAASLLVQLWSHHSAVLGGFLRITPIPLAHGLMLLTLGTIPLAVMEVVKLIRHRMSPARDSTDLIPTGEKHV
ncbi:MAG: cation-translocating P-type ATPase [Pseudomonadota bacterium]